MKMRTPGFLIGWLVSALLMYLLFYLFHGVLTNDLLKISIPKTAFLTVAGIVYLILAFCMSVLLEASFFKREVKSVYARAAIAGPLVGIFLYAVALIVGISFSAKFSMLNMMVDIGWQITEESVGIFFIAFVKVLTFNPNELEV